MIGSCWPMLCSDSQALARCSQLGNTRRSIKSTTATSVMSFDPKPTNPAPEGQSKPEQARTGAKPKPLKARVTAPIAQEQVARLTEELARLRRYWDVDVAEPMELKARLDRMQHALKNRVRRERAGCTQIGCQATCMCITCRKHFYTVECPDKLRLRHTCIDATCGPGFGKWRLCESCVTHREQGW